MGPAEVCAVALERGHLSALVNMSQMTVSQMTLTSVSESKHQRLHWFSEHVLNWSGLPVIHVRPTVFVDNPIVHLVGRAIGPRTGRAGTAVWGGAHVTDRRSGRGRGGRRAAA